jgi:RNA polymerase sigma-54 factor
VEEMIRAIQQFDPPGIGARDLKECLLLQLEALGKSNSKVAYLVKHHLDDLAKNRLPHISKKMNLSLVELQGVIDEVRKLNPNPGLSLVPDNPIFVAPEVFVERKGDAFVVMTNKDSLPRLRVSKTYLKMLDDPNISCEAKTYIKEKIIRAKNVMRSLVQRESTIKRIADVIVDEQYEFFLKGIEFLKPQTMQKVADKLGLHETTISRATTNKFMQTPHGLFEFKFFFSGGYQANNGEEMSSKSVMEKIREMILAEDSESPLSDQMITDELGKQGLNVARRTVAKYREELGIISSHLRKQHL